MSARKNVNQSRPRALADDGADDAAGAADERVTFVWRSSRPPANSRASVDTPTSPPPRGICGVGPSAECPPAFGLPSSHAANTSTPKAAILRIAVPELDPTMARGFADDWVCAAALLCEKSSHFRLC